MEERNTKKNGIINLLALFLVGIGSFVVARISGSAAGILSSVFIGLGTLVAAVSWFQMRLEETERIERLEYDELTRSKGGSTLFETKDSESFPAQQSREQFERFFVPGFTVLLFIGEAVGAYLLWRWLAKPGLALGVKAPAIGMALSGLFFLVLFILGRFSATLTRLEDHRLLRPSASWLLLGAYVSLATGVSLIGVWAGLPNADLYVARGLCAVLGLIAVETAVNLILEIYRPRVKGRVARPLYESRLVGLLGQPEGLITTAAQALDYQFGFKVSETWFYRFFEKALGWLILGQVLVLFLSTCVVFIEPGEQGVLEHFGQFEPSRGLLSPGAHLKWPWPIDHVYRYRTDQIQSFSIGFTDDTNFAGQNTIVWTVPHAKGEENFLVANRQEAAEITTNSSTGRPTPPVSLLAVSIPVQYQINNLVDWAYKNVDPTNLLHDIANRAVVRYLVNSDLNDIMSKTRAQTAEILRQRIQEAADARQLGVNIVFVGLQGIHPPVKVAADYEAVVSSNQTMIATTNDALAEAIRTNALAEAQATNLINQAMADRTRREVSAGAQAAAFTNQIPAYAAAPSVYSEREYLNAFNRATANSRKFILLTTNTHDVMVIDLQSKIREDLMNLNVGSPTNQ